MLLRHQLAAHSPVHAQDIAAAAGEVLRPGLSVHRQLVELLRRRYSADEVLLLDSGTHALQLAIQVAVRSTTRTGPVALPAFSCFDVATAAIGAGIPVLFYDLDPLTLAPDEVSLARAIDAGAAAIVVAPLYGVPVPWERIESLASRHDVAVIEDAAQGHGASWQERTLGSLGAISTISFGRGKGWTGGQGGALLLRGPRSRETLARLGAGLVSNKRQEFKTVLALAAQWLLGRPGLYGVPRAVPWLGLGETHYRSPSPVAELSRAAARALLSSDDAAQAESHVRRQRARHILSELPAGATPVRIEPGGVGGYVRLPIRLSSRARRRALTEGARLGMAPSYPVALSDLEPLQKHIVGSPIRYVGAQTLVDELITLPVHSRVDERDARAIVAGLSAACASA